jgi:hypothetical protein
MTRVEFTEKLVDLLSWMIDVGEHPIIDFVKRSDEEQKRLFDKGLSKCDGVNIKSQHQFGKAADLYFIENSQMVDPKNGWECWHNHWVEMGGKPMISWDRGHFEG